MRQATDGIKGKWVWPLADEGSSKYNIGQPDFTPLERTAAQKAHFFVDGKLYRMVRQDRARDILSVWDYDEEKIAHFVLSDAKKRMKNAYDTIEVAKLLNRHRGSIQHYVSQGIINSPVRIYEKGMNSKGHPFTKMKWSEDDILALHEFLLTNGGGRPRKDGILYSAARLPSRKELLAMMRQQPMFYMRTADGEFVPVWSAYGDV